MRKNLDKAKKDEFVSFMDYNVDTEVSKCGEIRYRDDLIS